jgi:hypothetical protein
MIMKFLGIGALIGIGIIFLLVVFASVINNFIDRR